jgi:alanine racemase
VQANLGSTHRTWAEIDLDALEYNFRALGAQLKGGGRIMAVIKADAYGHGAVPVAKELASCGVAFLGVAIWEEAAPLVEAGVSAPILILGGCCPEQASEIVRHDVKCSLFDMETARVLSRSAQEQQKEAGVHLKVDTGMGRLGIMPEDVPAFVRELEKLPRIKLEGVMSHLAAADDPAQAAYTNEQKARFGRIVKWCEENSPDLQWYHIDNSAAVLSASNSSYPLARLGIALYGSLSSPGMESAVDLKPVMRLKTRILQLRQIPAGWGISYGRTFVTERESRIGVLPAGYADGYPRSLSNRFFTLVRGRPAPIVGRVCMDMMMIDLTDIPEAEQGDEAVLIGADGGRSITADRMAEAAGTISYEILTGIGPRVPRIFIKNGAQQG